MSNDFLAKNKKYNNMKTFNKTTDAQSDKYKLSNHKPDRLYNPTDKMCLGNSKPHGSQDEGQGHMVVDVRVILKYLT